MNITSIQNFSFRNNIIKRTNNTISFGDSDGDKIIISDPKKPKEIRVTTPVWDFLNAQFLVLRNKNTAIQEEGKKLMREGWSMQFTTKKLYDDAQEIVIKSKQEYEECLQLVEAFKAHDYKSYRSNDYASGWSKREVERDHYGTTITEYDNDDEMEALRRLHISPDVFTYQKIRYFSGLIDEYVFDRQSGQLLSFVEGKSEFLSNGYKAQKVYNFNSDGELISYMENFKTKTNADSADKYYEFESGAIKKYQQDYYTGGVQIKTSASKILSFTDEGCVQADINYKDVLDGKKTISKQFLFDTHGNIDACACDLQEDKNGLTTASTVYMYENDILKQAAVKYKAYKGNNTVSAEKLFNFKLAGQLGGSCCLKNMGVLADNYKINNCMSEKIAIFYKA